MNIIFDVGNVLLSFAPLSYLEQVAGAHSQALLELIFHSEEWQDLDRGTIPLETACERFVERRPDLAVEIRTVMGGWFEMLVPIASNTDRLPEWKRQHRLYYLSNMPRQAAEYLEAKYTFWQLFDGGIFSYTTGLIKPDRAIYELLLQRYCLRAGDCVFIDDIACNVDAAVELGMRGVLCQPGADVSTQLTGL